MARLLYIHPGLVPPPADLRVDKFFYLSEILEGDALTPVWWKDEETARQKIGDRYPVSQAGRFRHHVYPAAGASGLARTFANMKFFIGKGLELNRQNRFDYIMTYGTNSTGVAGIILSILTGAKLIPDLPNAPEHQYLYEERTRTFTAHAKKLASDVLLHLVIWRSAIVKLLYPWQLSHYPLLRDRKAFVCHDFVPIRHIANEPPEPVQPIVLIVGHPWFRKGVDIAIQGFRKIASKFPGHRLVIVGMIPDRAYLDQLAAGCGQIEFRPALPSAQALKLIASCQVYLLASRSEGLARVLMEAMASGRPVVASAVCGTPYLVQDNESGLLFRPEDPDHLAEQLAKVLSNPDLAARLGRAARERVIGDFDEKAYVRKFKEMIAAVR